MCGHCPARRQLLFREPRKPQHGIFLNGEKINRQALKEGDVIGFGFDDSYKLIFHLVESNAASVENLISRMESIVQQRDGCGWIGQVERLLLEATRLLHSQLPLDAVLEAMLDRAIAIAHTDRGLLLEADGSGGLRQRLARVAAGRPPRVWHRKDSNRARRQWAWR